MRAEIERRRFPRYLVGNAKADVRVARCAFLRRNVAERVLDMGPGGARLLVGCGLRAGLRVLVRLSFPGRNESIATPAQVVWARGLGRRERRHVVGLAFDAPLNLIAAKLERLRRPRR